MVPVDPTADILARRVLARQLALLVLLTLVRLASCGLTLYTPDVLTRLFISGYPDDFSRQNEAADSTVRRVVSKSVIFVSAHTVGEQAATEAPPEPIVTSDYITELRCGMDTCIKSFRFRQKCVQQLLVHWEKGNMHDGFRYLSQLPSGKREAVVVDVLRATDLQSLGVDLEACLLLLPLISELFLSRFET